MILQKILVFREHDTSKGTTFSLYIYNILRQRKSNYEIIFPALNWTVGISKNVLEWLKSVSWKFILFINLGRLKNFPGIQPLGFSCTSMYKPYILEWFPNDYSKNPNKTQPSDTFKEYLATYFFPKNYKMLDSETI